MTDSAGGVEKAWYLLQRICYAQAEKTTYMETNKILQKQFLQIVNNQLKLNDPPETSQAFKRLKELGYNEIDAKKLIGQCVVVEVFDAMKNGKPFNEKRYIRNLNNLPKEPSDK